MSLKKFILRVRGGHEMASSSLTGSLAEELGKAGAQVPLGLLPRERALQAIEFAKGQLRATSGGGSNMWEAFSYEEIIDIQKRLKGTISVTSGMAAGNVSLWEVKPE